MPACMQGCKIAMHCTRYQDTVHLLSYCMWRVSGPVLPREPLANSLTQVCDSYVRSCDDDV